MAYSDATGRTRDTDWIRTLRTEQRNGGAPRNGMNLKGGPTVSCRVGSLSERVRRQLDPALKVPRSRSLLARTARPDARSRERRGETVRAENPSVRSGVRPWNGRAREGFLRGRHVRSTCTVGGKSVG